MSLCERTTFYGTHCSLIFNSYRPSFQKPHPPAPIQSKTARDLIPRCLTGVINHKSWKECLPYFDTNRQQNSGKGTSGGNMGPVSAWHSFMDLFHKWACQNQAGGLLVVTGYPGQRSDTRWPPVVMIWTMWVWHAVTTCSAERGGEC